MGDVLREFLAETNESLEVIDVELLRFEEDPSNAKVLGNVLYLVRAIKAACGFLGLPQLEELADAVEMLMGKLRDGMPATEEAVALILAAVERIKQVLDGLEERQRRSAAGDRDAISGLEPSMCNEAAWAGSCPSCPYARP